MPAVTKRRGKTLEESALMDRFERGRPIKMPVTGKPFDVTVCYVDDDTRTIRWSQTESTRLWKHDGIAKEIHVWERIRDEGDTIVVFDIPMRRQYTITTQKFHEKKVLMNLGKGGVQFVVPRAEWDALQVGERPELQGKLEL